MKTKYTRKELIEICEQAVVSQEKWSNRDSASSHIGIGTCWALLKAGCKFEIKITEDGDGCYTDDRTIWIQFWVKDFAWFEHCYDDDESKDGLENNEYHFYLPTLKRLKAAKGKDWY